MDGILMDRWSPRVLFDMVFGVFFKRSAKKVENSIEAPQSKLSLEGVVSSNVPRADVERHIVEFAFLCFLDQPFSFVG